MSKKRPAIEGPSLEAVAGIVVGLLGFYLAAEGLLPGNRHPIHWLITLVGGVAGYWTGTVIYRLKERRDLYGTFLRSGTHREGTSRPVRRRRRR